MVYQVVAFPILYKMMPNFGNSYTRECIELMENFIELFSFDNIDCLFAGQEFVGQYWLTFFATGIFATHPEPKQF